MSERQKICGVYCIVNLINDKKYIGKSTDIIRRWRDHCKIYGAKTEERRITLFKRNEILYKEMLVYGKENFNLKVLEQCSKEDLDEKEKYWINKLNTRTKEYGGNGYNIAKGGNISALHEVKNKKDRKNKKPTYQYDLDGNFVKVYPNLEKAAESVKGSVGGLYCALNRETPYRKYLWFTYRPQKVEKYKPLPSAKRKKIACYDLNGNFIKVYDYLDDILKDNSTSARNIRDCVVGRQRTAGGFVYKYIDENKKLPMKIKTQKSYKEVIQYDKNKNILKVYKHAFEASKELHVRQTTVVSNCNTGKLWKNCYWERR